MKVTGLYFSGTGNTKWVAEEISNQLMMRGHDIDMFSIEEIDVVNLIEKFKESDIIGFLYPGYGCEMPKIYEEYLEKLQTTKLDKNTKAFSITTAAIYIADGALIPQKFCKEIGAEFMWGNVVIMPCNFDTPVPGFRIPSDKRIETIKTKAKEKITKIVKKIEANEKSYDGGDLFNIATGKIQRYGWKKSMANYEIKINKSKCISCYKCVELCPAKNLSISEKGEPVKTNGNCSVCLRCINSCPTFAIRMFSSNGKSEYKKYKGPVA